ncbi:hypothetical protein Prudu_21S000700 [Prunus dulcis]|uniref:Uncharacterized protein n=1 Tax=Prunus dulcis TaxID=3755 RepID=A0A5H2XVW5_PRUDU|nr:hypothetical protein Prudu_21S000700 [Prunus dulcis]
MLTKPKATNIIRRQHLISGYKVI